MRAWVWIPSTWVKGEAGWLVIVVLAIALQRQWGSRGCNPSVHPSLRPRPMRVSQEVDDVLEDTQVCSLAHMLAHVSLQVHVSIRDIKNHLRSHFNSRKICMLLCTPFIYKFWFLWSQNRRGEISRHKQFISLDLCPCELESCPGPDCWARYFFTAELPTNQLLGQFFIRLSVSQYLFSGYPCLLFYLKMAYEQSTGVPAISACLGMPMRSHSGFSFKCKALSLVGKQRNSMVMLQRSTVRVSLHDLGLSSDLLLTSNDKNGWLWYVIQAWLKWKRQ